MNATPRESMYWNPSRKTITEDELRAFAARLHKRMIDLGLTQSDLARKAFGSVIGDDGVDRAKDRDKVSLYLRGKGLPGEQKMRQLAAALDLPLKELAPTPPAAPRELVTKDAKLAVDVTSKLGEGIRLDTLDGDTARLVVNVRLHMERVAEIIALITKAQQRD